MQPTPSQRIDLGPAKVRTWPRKRILGPGRVTSLGQTGCPIGGTDSLPSILRP